MDELREALVQASQENDMPAPLGGVLGGGWQWLWYATGDSKRTYRVDVSAEAGAKGLVVSGHLLSWSRNGDREAEGETWYSRSYPYDEIQRSLFVEHLKDELKRAWEQAIAASSTAS